MIKRQHSEPSFPEANLSGLHLINQSPTHSEQNAILSELSSTDRNGGDNSTILPWRAKSKAGSIPSCPYDRWGDPRPSAQHLHPSLPLRARKSISASFFLLKMPGGKHSDCSVAAGRAQKDGWWCLCDTSMSVHSVGLSTQSVRRKCEPYKESRGTGQMTQPTFLTCLPSLWPFPYLPQAVGTTGWSKPKLVLIGFKPSWLSHTTLSFRILSLSFSQPNGFNLGRRNMSGKTQNISPSRA